MTTYIISYDLRKRGERNYNELYDAIKSYGTWAHINESLWAVVTEQKAEDITNHLIKYVDDSDRIFVIKSGSEAAWINAICKDDWLKKHLK